MGVLRRLTAPRPSGPPRCELCGGRLAEDHRHLADTERRALACACTACALLFDRPGAGGGRFRTVPDRRLADPGIRLDAAAWEALGVPVAVAFFFRNSALGRLVACYPSPAGATEGEPDPEAWEAVLGSSPLAGLLQPDVEALLVRRTGDRGDCYLVPVDDAYGLVGRMRLHWRGFDGGAEARAELDAYFGRLAERAVAVTRQDGAAREDGAAGRNGAARESAPAGREGGRP
ncbi:DUF5947 family protein [Streptacidiphilus sp. ASG 303]|nr:DUF5947 family protein [Streptacidiphilus sp. ASG 303]MCD0485028.1 DUF5947 family protein [Streptacidiphilus sp. ASG 303]